MTLEKLRKAKNLSVGNVDQAMAVARAVSNSQLFTGYSIAKWERRVGCLSMCSDRITALAVLYEVDEETIKACPEVEVWKP